MEISCFLGKAVAFGLNMAVWFPFLLCNAASLLRIVSMKGRARRLRLHKKQNTTKQKSTRALSRGILGVKHRGVEKNIILICSMFLIAKVALPQSGQLLMRCD